MAKSAAENSVDAGTTGHTFTVKVTNNGPSDAVAVHLTDAINTKLTVTVFSDSLAGQVFFASAEHRVVHSFPTRRSSDLTYTVTYKVASSVAPATVSNTATAAAAGQATD